MGKKAALAAVLIILALSGALIGNKMSKSLDQKQDAYESAVQAKTKEEFQKLLRQKDAPVLAYGKLEADSPVADAAFPGRKFITLAIKQQRKKDDDWKTVDRQEKRAGTVLFLGEAFQTADISLEENFYEKQGNSRRRTVYSGTEEAEGTLFAAFLPDGGYRYLEFTEGSVEDAVKKSGSKMPVVLFGIFWGILEAAAAIIGWNLAFRN